MYRRLSILGLLLVCLISTRADAGIRGETIEEIEGGTADTTLAIQAEPGPVVFSLQANCDSLQVTVQGSLDGLTWANVGGPSWPIQINGTSGATVMHIPPRLLSPLPPDGAISSDFSPTTMVAPYLRVILNNNDASHDAATTITYRFFIGT